MLARFLIGALVSGFLVSMVITQYWPWVGVPDSSFGITRDIIIVNTIAFMFTTGVIYMLKREK